MPITTACFIPFQCIVSRNKTVIVQFEKQKEINLGKQVSFVWITGLGPTCQVGEPGERTSPLG